jgi:hypothetical protein
VGGIHLTQDSQVAGFCEDDGENLGTLKRGEFLTK